MRKTHDLAVKTGEYVAKDGQTKGRYQNVGSVLEGDDGRRVILLAKWFNPAGVPDPKGGDTILLSMFEPRAQEGSAAADVQKRVAAKFKDDDITF